MVSLHSKQTTALGKCTSSTCKRPLPTVDNTLEQIVHRTALRLLSPSGTNASLIAVMHENYINTFLLGFETVRKFNQCTTVSLMAEWNKVEPNKILRKITEA